MENKKTSQNQNTGQKFHQRDKYLRCPRLKILGTILKWTRKKLQQINLRTIKLTTMHKALHHRDDVDKLYESRKEGGRGLTRIQASVDGSIQQLEDYIRNSKDD